MGHGNSCCTCGQQPDQEVRVQPRHVPQRPSSWESPGIQSGPPPGDLDLGLPSKLLQNLVEDQQWEAAVGSTAEPNLGHQSRLGSTDFPTPPVQTVVQPCSDKDEDTKTVSTGFTASEACAQHVDAEVHGGSGATLARRASSMSEIERGSGSPRLPISFHSRIERHPRHSFDEGRHSYDESDTGRGRHSYQSENGSPCSGLTKGKPRGVYARIGDKQEADAEVRMLARHVKARQLDSQAKDVIRSGFRNDRVCAILPESETETILETMECFEFESGEVVLRQGEPGSHFFVCQSGMLEVRVGDTVVNTISQGTAFGGLALLYNCPRSATITARERSVVWGVNGRRFQAVLKANAHRHHAQNRACLNSFQLLSGLPDKLKDLLSEALFLEVFQDGARVVTQGEIANCMYFVKAGELREMQDGKVCPDGKLTGGEEIAKLRAEDSFGEREVLHREAWSSTVVAGTRCELLCISRAALKDVLGEDLHPKLLERSLILESLRRTPTFADFSTAARAALEQVACLEDQQPNQPLIMVGRLGLVMQGDIFGWKKLATEPETFSRGAWFGDYSIVEGASNLSSSATPFRASLGNADFRGYARLETGPSTCRVAFISREALAGALRRIAGDQDCTDEQAIDRARKMMLLKKVHVFRHLSQQQSESLVGTFILHRYNQGDNVVKQGERGTTFFVIAKGEVRILINGKTVRTLGRNAYFGERAILFDEGRSATVQVSSSRAELWAVEKSTFMTIVRGKMLQQLMHRITLQDTSVTLHQLRHVRLLGAGAVGVVRMVIHVETGTRYALKRIRKTNGKVPVEVKRELQLLGENDHPLLMQLVKTLETPQNVYILSELCTGGELYSAIRTIPDFLNVPQAQFYIGSLVLALEVLYDRNIVYRDLKPENVMLDRQGYLKLIDFGIAKRIPEGMSRTFTIIGTPHYMAPEIMLGHGYSLEVDLWSLGIILYELVCGGLPFAENSDNADEVVKAVLQQKLEFPDTLKDGPSKDLITGLLHRQPKKRLGAGVNGYDDIKNAKFFFIGYDNEAEGSSAPTLFDKLMGRELEPPLHPEAEKDLDDETDGLSDADELAPAP